MIAFIKDFIAWLKKRKEAKKRKAEQEYYNRLINFAYKAYFEFSSKADMDKAVIFVDGKRIK